ncbi:hypothetical protein ACO0K9_01025 [Undibacterium sp. Ji50W]|uniref:hypothetical protein n=1 Tax=Undibacterium sp. Ji50W TaxID=3413041 RepID=UPI003BF135FB
MKNLRTDSRAFQLLVLIVEMGGRVPLRDIPEADSEQVVYWLDVLRYYPYTITSNDVITVTPVGRERVDEYRLELGLPIIEKIEAVPLPDAMTVRPYQSLRKTGNARPCRPGMDDYRSIPSLIGGVRRLPGGEVIE